MSAWAGLDRLLRRWRGALSQPVPPVPVRLLAYRLGVESADLMALRARPWPDWFHYRPLRRRKRDGSLRRLYEPTTKLKALQRALLHNYLATFPVHPAATGFRKGSSSVANARRHLGQQVVITADIEGFFAATSRARVAAFFRGIQKDAVTPAILTRLCTFRGALPQGAPTSPILSNLVNRELDAELIRLVLETGGRYTRYCDDLTFSWPRGGPPAHVERTVRRALLDRGYRLNPHKGWRVYRLRRGEIPRVTGILLGRDGRLHPPPEVKEQMRRLRRQIRDDPHAAARLRGYQGFVDSLRS